MCVRTLARQPRRHQVQFRNQGLDTVVAHRRRIGIEGVGFENVGAGVEKLTMYVSNDLRSRNRQEIVIAFEIAGPVAESITAKVILAETVALDHRPHRAIEQHDAAFQRRDEGDYAFLSVHLDQLRRPPGLAARRAHDKSRRSAPTGSMCRSEIR